MKKLAVIMMLLAVVSGCSVDIGGVVKVGVFSQNFTIEKDDMKVTAQSNGMEYDHYEGTFTNGENFSVDGAKTDAEALSAAIIEAFKAGMAVKP